MFTTTIQAADYEFTLGAQTGYNASRSQFTDSSPTASSVAEYPINGPVLGLYANANIIIDAWRFGAELDYTSREQSSRESIVNDLDETRETKKLSFVDRQDASLLLGYQYTDQVRFYLRWGWSNASYTFEAFDSDTGTSNYSLELKAPHYGFGIQVNLTDQWSVRSDYRLTTFTGDRKENSITTEYDFEVHAFFLGLGYTF